MPITSAARNNEAANTGALSQQEIQANQLQVDAILNSINLEDGEERFEKVAPIIQRYGAERAQPLCYGDSHPYWFKDTNGDGACSQAESAAANRFASGPAKAIHSARRGYCSAQCGS